MQAHTSDTDLKQLLKEYARLVGLPLSDDRVERDLVAFKTHLAAIERIRAVVLPMEADPFVTLK